MSLVNKILGVLGVTSFVIGFLFLFSKLKDSEVETDTKGLVDGSFCVAINRNKFKVGWKFKNNGDDLVPSGTTGKLAEKYFDGKPGFAGKIGGFFKGIDTFPSEAAARYYKKDMIQWCTSDKAFDWWHMNVGELICGSEQTA